jgi:hypothetical protein
MWVYCLNQPGGYVPDGAGGRELPLRFSGTQSSWTQMLTLGRVDLSTSASRH